MKKRRKWSGRIFDIDSFGRVSLTKNGKKKIEEILNSKIILKRKLMNSEMTRCRPGSYECAVQVYMPFDDSPSNSMRYKYFSEFDAGKLIVYNARSFLNEECHMKDNELRPRFEYSFISGLLFRSHREDPAFEIISNDLIISNAWKCLQDSFGERLEKFEKALFVEIVYTLRDEKFIDNTKKIRDTLYREYVRENAIARDNVEECAKEIIIDETRKALRMKSEDLLNLVNKIIAKDVIES